MSLSLKELVSRMTVLNLAGPLNQLVTGLTHDARRVVPGMLYFALGPDGNETYADAQLALERGAVGVVARRGGKIRKRQAWIEVPDPRVALGEAAAVFHHDAAGKLRMIFVPGNCGHSQLALLVRQVLEGAGVKTALIGSVRQLLGTRELPAGRSLPEPSEMQGWIAQALEAGCTACVVETPLEGVSPDRFTGIGFDVAVLTNLPENLPAAFNRLLSQVTRGGAQSSKALVSVQNWDEPAIQKLGMNRCDALVRYGLEDGPEELEVSASEAGFDLGGSSFTLRLPSTRFRCHIPLLGRHNLSHVLAAASVALCLDVEPSKLQESLERLDEIPGNLEPVGKQGVSVLVDGARTREELRLVLSSLREMASGRVLMILGCEHGTTGRGRYEIGQTAGELADYLVLTSDNPGREPVEQICSAIAQGIERKRHAAYHFQPDRALAIREAVEMARPGDIVLLAGKGERTRQELAYTIIPFHDRHYAEAALRGLEDLPEERNRLEFEPVTH